MTARAVHQLTHTDGPQLLVPVEVSSYFTESPGGFPEARLVLWAAQFLTPKSIFVDVGAHCGTWTLTLASRCSAVHAFEPQRQTYSLLRGGVMLNGVDHKVRTHQVALSDDIGDAELRIVSADGGGSSLRKRRIPGDDTNEGRAQRGERCRRNKLDHFLGNETHIDLIKIDTEGTEESVIRGAIRTIKSSNHPPIIFEAWSYDWFEREKFELINYVQTFGYHVEPIKGFPEMYLATHPNRKKST